MDGDVSILSFGIKILSNPSSIRRISNRIIVVVATTNLIVVYLLRRLPWRPVLHPTIRSLSVESKVRARSTMWMMLFVLLCFGQVLAFDEVPFDSDEVREDLVHRGEALVQ